LLKQHLWCGTKLRIPELKALFCSNRDITQRRLRTPDCARAGTKLLAHVLFAWPALLLHRQSDVYQRGGIDLDVSTLAEWVGACAAT
jgi:hypothetical protein